MTGLSLHLDTFKPKLAAGMLYSLVGLTIIFLMLPIVVIIPISFSSAQYLTFPPPGYSLQWYERLVERPEWASSLWLSVRVAALCMIFSLILGVSAAFALVRGRFRGKNVIYSAILSPMILPHVIISLGAFFLFSRLHLLGSVWAIALGHTIIVFPIVVIIVSATLRGFDRRLEQAAIILGASPLRAFWRITLPIIRPAVVSSGLFAFLLSFDELLLSLFLSDLTSTTLPMRIWENTFMEISPVIAAVSTLLVGISFLVLLLTILVRRD